MTNTNGTTTSVIAVAIAETNAVASRSLKEIGCLNRDDIRL